MNITYDSHDKLFSIHNLDYEYLSLICSMLNKKIKELEYNISKLQIAKEEIIDVELKKQINQQIRYYKNLLKQIILDVKTINNILEMII